MIHSNLFSQKSDPGLLGPVYIIFLVRSGPDGPQFVRSDQTLLTSKLETEKTLLSNSK